MNLNKELPQSLIDAMNKCREAGAEIDKALNVPRETEEVKKLKGTVEGFQVFTVFALLTVVMMGVCVYAIHDSRNYWRGEAESARSKYLAELRSGKPLQERSTTLDDSVDLVNAQKNIHSLELQLANSGSKVSLCYAQRDADAARYEYKILKEKTGK